MLSAFFVTDVRHAFVSVHILLEWEISRKASLVQEKRILPLFSELEYSLNLEHSGGYPCYSGHPGSHIPSREVRIFSRRCPPVLCRARSPTPGTPHPPHLTPSRSIQRLLGQPSQMNNWHSSKNRLLPNGSLIHVTVRYFINGRLGTSDNPLSFQVSSRAKQYQTKSPARSANYMYLCTAVSFKDAPEPGGRRRVN